MGVAFNEVVVALIDEGRSVQPLRRFTTLLSLATTLIILTIAATPLARIWLEDISALSPSLAMLARNGLWIGLLLPALNALQSWYQGIMLNSGKTRGISEAVVIFIVVTAAVLSFGVFWGEMVGLYIGLIAFSAGMLVQTLWLYFRSRKPMAALILRDAAINE